MGAVKHLLQEAYEHGMDYEEAEDFVEGILYPQGKPTFVGPIERLRILQKRAKRPYRASRSVRGRYTQKGPK